MEEEDHTSQEIIDQPKADDDKQSKDIPDYSKRKSSRFAFDLDSDHPSWQKSDKAMRKLDSQHRMLELKHQWKLLRADDDSNSDDSTLTEVAGDRRKKSKAVYEKPPIKPERFPGKDFNRWELWVKHYKSVAKANGWSDQQAIAALPACLTSWAVEKFETRAQELELIQKNARDAELRREKPVRGENVRYVADDADSDEVVRASFQSFPSQVQEKFVAHQTSMSTVANRLDKLDHTIAKQGEANHQMMKSRGKT